MLGRIGMALGNASIATDAYANAYRLDPKNSDAALGYAEALTRSSDPNDNRLGWRVVTPTGEKRPQQYSCVKHVCV